MLGQQNSITDAEISFEFPSKEVSGTIAGFVSASYIDWENPERSTFKGSVAVESLDTNIGLRNWMLKNKRYFNADAYPRIYFESTEVREAEGILIVKGNLTLKGTTKPIEIEFRPENEQLIGTTQLFSSDFGITIKKKREANLVEVRMVFTIK